MQTLYENRASAAAPKRAAANADTQAVKANLACHRLKEHFGAHELEGLQVYRHTFPIWMRVDIQASLLNYFEGKPGHHFHGCRLRGDGLDFRFPNLLDDSLGGIAIGPPVHSLLDLGDGELVRTMLRGLWLDMHEGIPYAVLLEREMDSWHSECRIEIALPSGADEERFARWFIDQQVKAGERADTLRGRVLSPGGNGPEGRVDAASVEFQRLPMKQIDRQEIILDDKTLELFERNTFGFLGQVDALSKMGFSTRKGILLYGPPGTGKTLLTQYLVSKLDGFTRMILTPANLHLLAETMTVVRKTSPAVVVIEDVDLIAEDREYSAPGESGMLNRLLNEMDGLTPRTQVLFVLTTNRPEVLEPALASRPGRIDQAIEIGLPEDKERRMLLAYFAGQLNVTEQLVERVSKLAGKVSPAFLKELVRRAAQYMLEANSTVLDFALFEAALNDMVKCGGTIGAKLTGAKTAGFV